MQRKIRFGGTATRATMLCIKIDNIEIYNGPIPEPVRPANLPSERIEELADLPYLGFVEWETGPAESIHTLELSVTGDKFRFERTFSNYMKFWTLDDLNTALSSGADKFMPAYAQQESDTVYYRDSNSDVKINDILQPRNSINEWQRIGQWHWNLEDGDVLTSTMSLSETFDQAIWDPQVRGEFDETFANYLVWRPNHQSMDR